MKVSFATLRLCVKCCANSASWQLVLLRNPKFKTNSRKIRVSLLNFCSYHSSLIDKHRLTTCCSTSQGIKTKQIIASVVYFSFLFLRRRGFPKRGARSLSIQALREICHDRRLERGWMQRRGRMDHAITKPHRFALPWICEIWHPEECIEMSSVTIITRAHNFNCDQDIAGYGFNFIRHGIAIGRSALIHSCIPTSRALRPAWASTIQKLYGAPTKGVLSFLETWPLADKLISAWTGPSPGTAFA